MSDERGRFPSRLYRRPDSCSLYAAEDFRKSPVASGNGENGMAEEIARRWNAHDALRARVEALEGALRELTESSCESACYLPPWTHTDECERGLATKKARALLGATAEGRATPHA